MKIEKINLLHIWTYSKFERDHYVKYLKKNKATEALEEKSYFLDKLNLFYGENWSGKSTLAKLLRYLNGDLDIWEKLVPRWSTDDLSVDIYTSWWNLIDNNDLNEKIIFFDKLYIKDQVGDFIYNQDESSSQNKSRGEHFLLIGAYKKREETIQILENTYASRKDKFDENSTRNSVLEKSFEANFWLDWSKKYDIIINDNLTLESLAEKLLENEEKKKELDKLATKKREVQNLSSSYKELNEIDNLTDTLLESFIKTQRQAIDFEYWWKNEVENLVKIMKDEKLEDCILCNQSILDTEWEYIDRINKLMDQLEKWGDKISQDISILQWILNKIKEINNFSASVLQINQKNYSDYRNIRWDSSVVYPEFNLSFSDSQNKSIKDFSELIKEKQNKLSVSLVIGNIGEELKEIVILINEKVRLYNKELKEIEKDVILLKSTSVDRESQNKAKENVDLAQTMINIYNKKNEIDLFFKNKRKIVAEWEEIKKSLEHIENEKVKIRSDFEKFTQEKGGVIKLLLEIINPPLANKIDFNLKWTYSQWKWRCWFEIKHLKHKNTITKNLSEWEKRSVAFAYFLSEFYEFDKVSWKISAIEDYWKWYICVFDDPSTDYDKNNKYEIAKMIVDFSEWFDQSFILTHDEKFRDYIIKQHQIQCFSWEIRRYKISKNYLWVSYIETMDQNQRDLFHNMMIEAMIITNPDLSCNAHALRYCVEYMLSNELLWEWEDSYRTILENQLWKKGIDRLIRANEMNTDIKSLYSFCNSNGSHYWEADSFQTLSSHIRKYFETYDYIFEKDLTTRILPLTP